jgi:outer membrane immunogenic protein
MRKLFLGSLMLAATLAGPAVAADMPLKAPPPVYFNWTGMYFGGSIGGAWGRFEEFWPITDHNFVAGTDINFRASAITFDAHIGYQYQYGWLVVGAEASGNWFYNMYQQAIFNTAPPCTFAPAGNGTPCGAEARANWSIEGVGRLGVAFDRWMVYAKGGYGAVELTSREVQCCNPLGFVGNPFLQPSSYLQQGQMHGAAVAGGGVEYAWTNQVFVGVDYKHYFIQTSIHSGPCPDTAGACAAPALHQLTFSSSGIDVVSARITFRPFWDTYVPTPVISK